MRGAPVANPVLAELSDGELLAYTERLARKTVKQVAPFSYVPLLVLPVFGLIFFGDDLGIPTSATMMLITLAYLAAIPLIMRFGRTDTCRMEAVLQIAERGRGVPARLPHLARLGRTR